MRKIPFAVSEKSVRYTKDTARLEEYIGGDYELKLYEKRLIENELHRRQRLADEKTERESSKRRNAALIELLSEQTASLKKQYLEMTAVWAQKDFNRVERVCEEYRTTPKNDFIEKYDCDFYYSVQKKYWGIYANILRDGADEYIAGQQKLAATHYEDSIIKLAGRIEKKNLKQDRLTVETAHLGVNISTVLTDGEKSVKAWTIIASGEVQRPHYRYLIK